MCQMGTPSLKVFYFFLDVEVRLMPRRILLADVFIYRLRSNKLGGAFRL